MTKTLAVFTAFALLGYVLCCLYPQTALEIAYSYSLPKIV